MQCPNCGREAESVTDVDLPAELSFRARGFAIRSGGEPLVDSGDEPCLLDRDGGVAVVVHA